MSRYTITPWRTHHDLLEVRSQLYNTTTPSANTPDPSIQRHATSRIQAWKLRGNLPHAVESTALLIDAQLHHSIPGTSNFSIRAVYSAAFTRFVTGFCDIGRNRERLLEPSSMLAIAKQIGMPGEFVALRHEATHEELPSIQRLVGATREALGWLWMVYWGRLEEVEDLGSGVQGCREEVVGLMRGFRRARRDALRQGLGREEQRAEVSRTRDGIVERCGENVGKIKAVAEASVEERLILPATREMGSSLDGAFLIWDDLLLDLSEHLPGFRQALIMGLLESIRRHTNTNPTNDTGKEALSMWLLHILAGWYPRNDVSDELRIQVDVLKWCCLHPGYWSEYIGQRVLQSGDPSLKEDWIGLFEASCLSGRVASSASSAHSEALQQRVRVRQKGTLTADAGNEGSVEALKGWQRAIDAVALSIGIVS